MPPILSPFVSISAHPIILFCVPESVESLNKAILIFTDLGLTDWAAKHHHAMAETFEHDLADEEKALEHYAKAADLIKNVSGRIRE